MSNKKRRPRVAIDTNVFVSGLISSRGAPGQLLDMLKDGAITIVVGIAQQDELQDVLRRPLLRDKYSIPSERIEELLDLVDEIQSPSEPPQDVIVVRDPDDQEILQTAVAARVDYLVTGGEDLLVLAEEPSLTPLRIVNPRDFVDMFESAG